MFDQNSSESLWQIRPILYFRFFFKVNGVCLPDEKRAKEQELLQPGRYSYCDYFWVCVNVRATMVSTIPVWSCDESVIFSNSDIAFMPLLFM